MLRTQLLDGFAGSSEQWAVLRTELPRAALAGLVRRPSRPDQLELASAADVHDGNVGWATRALVAAARAQAFEARHLLSSRRALSGVGLKSMCDPVADPPQGFLDPSAARLRHAGRALESLRHPAREIALCVETLARLGHTRVSPTPWGVVAALGPDDRRSILEIKRDTGRPLLGAGVSVSLWTALRGSHTHALELNEQEAAPWGQGTAFGRWWAAEGGPLVHSSFVPGALFEQDLLSTLLDCYAKRAVAHRRVELD